MPYPLTDVQVWPIIRSTDVPFQELAHVLGLLLRAVV